MKKIKKCPIPPVFDQRISSSSRAALNISGRDILQAKFFPDVQPMSTDIQINFQY